MKKKKYNINDVGYSGISFIPKTCSFCKNQPIGILKIKKLFTTKKRWICTDCRIKWVKGELEI